MLHRLKSVQDTAARLCMTHLLSPRSHASPSRKQLHWLPASSRRIQFKLCIRMFDVWHNTAPQTVYNVMTGDSSRARVASLWSVRPGCTWLTEPFLSLVHAREILCQLTLNRLIHEPLSYNDDGDGYIHICLHLLYLYFVYDFYYNNNNNNILWFIIFCLYVLYRDV